MAQINERGTELILVEFRAPAVVEDILYPQLRKAEESVKALLERNGFSLLRSDVAAYRDRAAMLFEMEVGELSKASCRIGPPVWEAEHIARFLAAHPSPLSGPYIARRQSCGGGAPQIYSGAGIFWRQRWETSPWASISPSPFAVNTIYMWARSCWA